MISPELIGFENDFENLKKLITKKTFPHAILIAGKPSIGKRLFARHIAACLLANNVPEDKSALKSHIISEIPNATYPDLHIIELDEEKSNISVEQVREVINKLSLSSYYPMGSVVIINDAENMSISAGNALLKNLEEPEANKYFILTTSHPHLVSETIRSRTQTIDCTPRTSREMQAIIMKIAKTDILNTIPENELENFLDGSLDIFNLGSLINNQTLLPKSEQQVEAAIRNTYSKLTELRTRVAKILNLNDSLDLKSQLIQFIRSSDKDENETYLKIKVLISALKEHCSKSFNQTSETADTLLKIVSKLSEIEIRHLDKEVQLSSIIL